MQRKPSHFGSYCHSSPTGISSTERASIGGSGGLSWSGMIYFVYLRGSSFGGRFPFRTAPATQM
jgi:hypothetical protein